MVSWVRWGAWLYRFLIFALFLTLEDTTSEPKESHDLAFIFVLFVLLLYVPVNSYDHGGTVSSPNHTFLLGKLVKAVNK